MSAWQTTAAPGRLPIVQAFLALAALLLALPHVLPGTAQGKTRTFDVHNLKYTLSGGNWIGLMKRKFPVPFSWRCAPTVRRLS